MISQDIKIWFDSIKRISIYDGAWGCLEWPSACHAEDSDGFDSRKHRKLYGGVYQQNKVE